MECHEIESAVFAKERRVKNKTSLPRFDLKKYRVEEATAVVIVTVGDDRRVQSMYGGQFRLFHHPVLRRYQIPNSWNLLGE